MHGLRIKIIGANLAATWVAECESRGMTRAAALRHLHAVCECSYTNSRLNEMIRGERQPARPARIAMMQMVLPPLLADLGITITPDQYSDLAEALT